MKNNIMQDLEPSASEEILKTIYSNKNIKIERIVSNGQISPQGFWYDQEEYEFVLLVEGNAVIEFENYKVSLKKNDFIMIEPHKKHRITYTSKPAYWLCVFFK